MSVKVFCIFSQGNRCERPDTAVHDLEEHFDQLWRYKSKDQVVTFQIHKVRYVIFVHVQLFSLSQVNKNGHFSAVVSTMCPHPRTAGHGRERSAEAKGQILSSSTATKNKYVCLRDTSSSSCCVRNL